MKVSYENWEGKTRERLIEPHYIYFSSTQWHVLPQWLLRCTDLVTNEAHDFALSKMITLDTHELHFQKD